MQFDVHVYFHNATDSAIAAALSKLSHQQEQIIMALDQLQAAVTAEGTVVDSAIVLLQGLAAKIAALTPDQAAIDALAAEVTAKTQALSDAVVANTPATP